MRVAGPLEPLVGNVQSMCLVELRRGALYPPGRKGRWWRWERVGFQWSLSKVSSTNSGKT